MSYLAQKILIHEKRDRESRAKDVLYMHDALEVFGAWFPELAELWLRLVSPKLSRRALRAVAKASEALFGAVSDDVRRAAEISPERALSPENIRAVCRYGLVQVFGSSQ